MNKKNILDIVESVSNEKSLEKNTIFNILEKSLETSIKKKINIENIKVIFNRNNGNFNIFRKLKIVKNLTNKKKEILLDDCVIKYPLAKLNDYIEEEINNFKFNRIISKFAKQIILYKIRKIEKNNLIKNFKNLIGNIYTGVVKKILNKKIIFDIGYEFEAVLNNNNILFNDKFEIGKKLKILLYDVKYSIYGLKFLVSRSHIYIIYTLLNDINEFKKNIFKIKFIVRNPGIRTKVIIETNNKLINMYNINNRIYYKINKISNYLNGEKIELILWNKNLQIFIKNILFPIKTNLITINSNIKLYIKKNNLNILLGKDNSNIKLINKILDKHLLIKTY